MQQSNPQRRARDADGEDDAGLGAADKEVHTAQGRGQKEQRRVGAAQEERRATVTRRACENEVDSDLNKDQLDSDK